MNYEYIAINGRPCYKINIVNIVYLACKNYPLVQAQRKHDFAKIFPSDQLIVIEIKVRLLYWTLALRETSGSEVGVSPRDRSRRRVWQRGEQAHSSAEVENNRGPRNTD